MKEKIDTKILDIKEIELKIILPETTEFRRMMILLHGKTDGDCSLVEAMIRELEIEKLAEKYQMLIVVPYLLENPYCASTEECDYIKWISGELESYVENKYLNGKNVEKVIAGVSAGGYGAVLTGLNSDVFHHVVSVSGSFIEDSIMIGNPEVWGNWTPACAEGTFLSYFLPLSDLMESKLKSVGIAIAESDSKPMLYFSCGTKDWLYSKVQDVLWKAEKQGFSCKFYELEGEAHTNQCFRRGLWSIVENIFSEEEEK